MQKVMDGKVIDVTPATPDAIRVFLDSTMGSSDFVEQLFAALIQEKATQFEGVNRYLESFVFESNQLAEEIANYQLALEHTQSTDQGLLDRFEDLHRQIELALMELHRNKMRLVELKIAVCRFIVLFEAPTRDAIKPMKALEEWMDGAALAEMRLARMVGQEQNRQLQQQLAVFLTFRSIICSYDGPSMYIRQLENSLSSMQALYEKSMLELEVYQAAQHLDETRKELSTVKFNLNSIQSQLKKEQQQAEQLTRLISLQDAKPNWIRRIIFLVLVAAGSAFVYGLLRADYTSTTRKVGGIVTQKSCQDIATQIEKSPRYQSQVLIFRKFGSDIYFRANAVTCEKLHRLDSVQVSSLAGVLHADFEAGNQSMATFNGNRVLQIKEVGVNTLVLKLMNRTNMNLAFKVQVLELATLLKGVLKVDKNGLEDDLLLVELQNPQKNE